MSEERAKRKLSAILSADVKGYSRLMGEDELATVETLKKYREVITSFVGHYSGRVVDSPGDNILAEFDSVVDAVECAVKIQDALKEQNAQLTEDRRMEFRIGVNLGDVIDDEGRIYGDGVNVAARVEGLAEGGGICISGTAFDQIGKKLPLGYQYLGEQEVKNIEKPVRVYKVLTEPEEVGKLIGEEKPKPKGWRWAVLAAAIVILVAGVLAFWTFYLRPDVEPASVEKMAFPLPDKPSIAVLPFTNMSGDPKQEYFSDGMTDDLITDLSKISGLLVIARSSTFAYKGKEMDVRQVSRELGVRYLLEGSVRKAGQKVRINAQLIDATTRHHLWAERYDGKMGDIFALQDGITRKIISALAVRLTTAEQNVIYRKDTESVVAYDAFLQGWEHYIRHTPKDFVEALQFFKDAIGHDPRYGRAYAALASTYLESFYRLWHPSLKVTYGESRYLAEKYLKTAMEYPTSLAYQVSSKMNIDWMMHEKAIAEAEHSIAHGPNDPNSYLTMALALVYSGRAKEALDFVKKAMRLNPQYPGYYLFVLGLAQLGTEQLQDAASSFIRAFKRNPENYVVLIPLAAVYAQLGREHEAKATIAKLKKIEPTLTLSLVKGCPLWRYKDRKDKARLLAGLRKAGLK